MAVVQLHHPFSQIVESSVDAAHQSELVTALINRDERFTSTCPGFVSANVQASHDGLRVLHQVLWRSRQECENAMLNAEPGEQDLCALMRRFRAGCATFGSFRVMGQIAARR